MRRDVVKHGRKEDFNKKSFLIDIIVSIIGTFLFSAALHIFTSPNQIAPGGVAGISTIIHHLTGLPLGAVNITLNIPIMIVGLIYLGKRFMFKTFISVVTLTISMDYILINVPTYSGDMIVAALFGGILMGTGIGLVFTRSSSTGGMDIINKIINKKIPHIKLGRITFCTDIVIITISGIAFKSVDPALYAIIAIFISSKALDAVLYGFNICKLMYIVTDQADIISKEIISKMKRGATILESHGAYTNQRKPTIMCAVRQNEYFKLKKIIHSIDPNAFIIITSANEIVGMGFQSNEV